MLTRMAQMLTVDQRGQNYLARREISKSCINESWGMSPPKRTMMRMVKIVSLNPQIV